MLKLTIPKSWEESVITIVLQWKIKGKNYFESFIFTGTFKETGVIKIIEPFPDTYVNFPLEAITSIKEVIEIAAEGETKTYRTMTITFKDPPQC